MELQEFKSKYYFFDSKDYGNIYIFVDFGNVRPWAKEFWPEENKYRICIEIDIKKLAGVCDWVNPKRKTFYYGYYSEQLNDKHKNSILRVDKARKSGFRIKTKEIKMIPRYDEDGKYIGKIPKCNFDVEIAMDMLMKINKYDSIMLFSGDSDFGALLGYLKSKGKKIIIVSARNRMSRELEKVADKFIPAETLKEFLKYENKNTPPAKAEV